tara:strand:+ start:470 stop:1252 length:783 start_codon:yes stop_codon:yes gene_type:complete
MKKLPYFPFYYLDWLSSSSVSMMTHEEKGLFIDMLSRCYNDDGLPDDNNKLQRLFNCTDDLLWTVKEMFYSVDGLLKNEKLDSIIKDQSIMVKGKSKAGKASAKARADKKLQSATPVQHVLNPVATETKRNSTNRTEQNKAEQNNKDIKSKPKKFTAPTIEEVKEYCDKRLNSVDPDIFVSHYEVSGWMRGKTKIKDWQACVRTWEKNSSNNQTAAKTHYAGQSIAALNAIVSRMRSAQATTQDIANFTAASNDGFKPNE